MNRDNFDGSIFDADSDLQMLGFRMYDNETGRFTTPDLLWSAFPTQTPYHYAYNSPLTYRDPSGLAPEKEKEGEELMGWVFDGENWVFVFTNVEVTASRIWDHNSADFLTESYKLYVRNQARLAEWHDWWMNNIYYWKGPAGSGDYRTQKGYINLSINPNDKGYKPKQDLTKVFNEHLDKLAIYFKAEKVKFENRIDKSEITSYKVKELLRILEFGGIQWKGQNSNFLNPKQAEPYINSGIFNGEEFRADDFGNYAYGVAAREFGINWMIAIWGAGAFSSYNHYNKGTTENIQFFNLPGLGDDWSDSFMIFRGYMVGGRAKK
jgi:RHS repeat-associated protein